MKVDTEIETIQKHIKDLRNRIKWLRSRRKILETLPAAGVFSNQVDFDCLPHKEVIKVIRALGGKWKKEPNSADKTRIDYIQEIDGVTVRCWKGEPPPSCRLVEVEEQVPELVIPAHTKKVLKMICTGEEPVAVAISRAVTNNNQPQS